MEQKTISGKRKVTETQIVTEICEYLTYRRFFFWRENNIPVYGRSLPKYTPRGLPDIFALIDGLLIGIEVKRPASEDREKNGRTIRQGKLTIFQAEFGNKMVIHGAKYLIVHSLDELRNGLDLIFVRSAKDLKTANLKNENFTHE